MIKEFKPIPAPAAFFSESKFHVLLKKGQLATALKLLKKNNQCFERYQDDFAKSAQKMILSKRISELLSFIYNNPNVLNLDKVEMLRKAFEVSDYHGFLKNCHRFKIYGELQEEIEDAILKVRPEESRSWKRKFTEFGADDVI